MKEFAIEVQYTVTERVFVQAEDPLQAEKKAIAEAGNFTSIWGFDADVKEASKVIVRNEEVRPDVR